MNKANEVRSSNHRSLVEEVWDRLGVGIDVEVDCDIDNQDYDLHSWSVELRPDRSELFSTVMSILEELKIEDLGLVKEIVSQIEKRYDQGSQILQDMDSRGVCEKYVLWNIEEKLLPDPSYLTDVIQDGVRMRLESDLEESLVTS